MGGLDFVARSDGERIYGKAITSMGYPVFCARKIFSKCPTAYSLRTKILVIVFPVHSHYVYFRDTEIIGRLNVCASKRILVATSIFIPKLKRMDEKHGAIVGF